jgi:hypothetical protein
MTSQLMTLSRFGAADKWRTWLKEHHRSSPGVLARLFYKSHTG